MTEQKFFIGDRVRVRPYDKIDTLDIGNSSCDSYYCYGIPKRHIDRASDKSDGFVIRNGRFNEDKGMFIYDLVDLAGKLQAYYWAQGMLCPYEEETELPEPDPSGLFSFIMSE